MDYRNFYSFSRECTNMKWGDSWSIHVLLLGVMNIIWVFLKAAFVMVSLSNKCISLICLQRSKLTWQPNVPNASGVGLFWDKKIPPRAALFYSDKKNNLGKIQRKCWKTIKFLIFSSKFFVKNNLSVIFTKNVL